MKLDKELPIPLYHQLKKVIEEKILSREWPPGYQLPTEVELAKMLNISRITIKRAIFELVNEGLLYRQQGKGTFVSSEREEKDLFQLVTLSNGEEDTGKGLHPHQTISFSIEPAGLQLAAKLNVLESDTVIKIHRLKIDNDEPVGVEYSYLPYSRFKDFTLSLIEDDLIYNVLKTRYKVPLDRAKIYLAPATANGYEATLLNIAEGSPLFVWERTTFAKDQGIVEYSKFMIRQDKARYYLEVSL